MKAHEQHTTWLDDMIIDIKVKTKVMGHRVPWPKGYVVAFAEHLSHVGGQGYRRIGVHEPEDGRWIPLPFETKGIVTDHCFAVEDYVSSMSVTCGRLASCTYMWYWVEFPKEFLWVRCDWLVGADP